MLESELGANPCRSVCLPCAEGGPPAMRRGIKQAGTSPSLSTSELGASGEQLPCSGGGHSL